jgi:hypothetical protein
MRYLLPLAVLLLLLAAQGCYYDNEEYLYPNSFCDTSAVTYTSTIAPLVQANCAVPGCHVPGGTGPGDFTSYIGVKAKVDNGSFRAVTIVNKSMPPSGPLSNCEQQQLSTWLDTGAPNN